MATTKRQLSFYAETDVDLYLSYMTPGSKTSILNDAIRGRMLVDAVVDLNDGSRPVNFGLLSEADQSEVRANLILKELSRNSVDAHIWEVVRETASRNWKENTRRYLTLHHLKFREPFRIKKLRSQAEQDSRPVFLTQYYCFDHQSKTAEYLDDGIDRKCVTCGANAGYRDSEKSIEELAN